jgi:hypothetical protein
MACEPIGGALNIAARSLSQSIHGTGAVASESAGSSAPYFLAIDARIVIARTPASLLTVHLPSLSAGAVVPSQQSFAPDVAPPAALT